MKSLFSVISINDNRDYDDNRVNSREDVKRSGTISTGHLRTPVSGREQLRYDGLPYCTYVCSVISISMILMKCLYFKKVVDR